MKTDHVTKTGSGQTQGKHSKNRVVAPFSLRDGRFKTPIKVRKRISFAPFDTKNASFYQDRLGTNIGESTQKKMTRCGAVLHRPH